MVASDSSPSLILRFNLSRITFMSWREPLKSWLREALWRWSAEEKRMVWRRTSSLTAAGSQNFPRVLYLKLRYLLIG